VLIANDATNNTVGPGNVISGNTGSGVTVNGLGTGNVVSGNLIGTDASGTAALGNAQHGVQVSAPNTTVGGTSAAARNVISGNGVFGVLLKGATGAQVQGNYIGTDVTGTAALGNALNGIGLDGASNNNTIGGPAAGAGNVIAANGQWGVEFAGGSNGNVLQGNFIGTDPAGDSLGNASDGVRVDNGAANNTIGGTGSGDGNTIAFNSAYGVDVDSGTGNSILGNSVFANGIQGIFLNGANNANDNQAAPVLTGGSFSSSGSSISGTLTSVPNTTFRIEFFANQGLDPSGNVEGQTYLGFATVTTDNNGHAAFTATGLAPLPAGERYPTATATDLTTGSTSEFAVNPPASVTAAGGDGQTATVTTAFAAPLQVVVRDAFGDPLANVPVTFAAPASGPSGTFGQGEGGPGPATVVVFTDQFGVATAFGYTANTVAGVDRVTATVQGVPSFTFTLTNLPDTATQFVFTGPAAPTAGAPATFTVTALDQFGNVDTGFAGTVSFTSSDARATLPAAYTFTTGPGGDDGAHTFTATFLTAGPQTLTVTDPDPITATTSFVVQPGAAVALSVGGFPSGTPAGVPGMVTVVALDAFGNVATGYTGVVHFSSNDPTAVLPPDATLTGGMGNFPVTFLTSGVKTITVNDTARSATTGAQVGINITAVLLPQAVLFIPIVNQPFDSVVASFTSSLSPNAGDYVATISWGDGTTSPGVITTADGQTFNVFGTHTYHIQTDFLVDVKVTYLKTGAFETTAPSAAAVVSASQGAQLAEIGFIRGRPGDTSLSASNGVVDAELSQPSPNSLTATVFVARYRNNPQPAFTDGSNFYDVRVTGSGPGALLVVTFRFSEANATAALLQFFDQATGTYMPVQSATRFPVVVDLAGQTITVTFDATSFPKLKDLVGSVFSISVTVPPSPPQSALSPAASLASAGQGAAAQEVAFQPSTQLGLSLVPSQTSTLAAARADLTGAAPDSGEMSDDDFRFLVDLLNAVLGDAKPGPDGRPAGRPASSPAGRDATAGPEEEQEPAPGPNPGEVRAEPAPDVDPLDAFFAKSGVEGPDLTLPPVWAEAAGADGVLERSAEGRPTLLAAPLVGALLAGVPARAAGRPTRRVAGRRPRGL
jgi:hypothetical protein